MPMCSKGVAPRRRARMLRMTQTTSRTVPARNTVLQTSTVRVTGSSSGLGGSGESTQATTSGVSEVTWHGECAGKGAQKTVLSVELASVLFSNSHDVSCTDEPPQ